MDPMALQLVQLQRGYLIKTILLCMKLVLLLKMKSNNSRQDYVARQKRLRTAVAMLLLKRQRQKIPRRCWMQARSQDWWDTEVANFDDNDWIDKFRMKKSSFQNLVSLLKDDLEPDTVTVRDPIPVEKRVAVAVYKLAWGAKLQSVGDMFGMHKTSVHRWLHGFCDALCKRLKIFIYLPNSTEAKEIACANFEKTGFPQIYGAIDACHIHVKPPRDGTRDYMNRNMFPSLVLQAVVDNKHCFRDISVKMPGSVHEASVLHASNLYKNADNLPKGSVLINDVDIPLMLVGNASYPMLPYLMRPYCGSQLTEKQERFNQHHNDIRIAVEDAFVRLKSRWRILKGRLDVDVSRAPFIIAACCILHNICEESNVPVPTDDGATVMAASEPLPDTPIDNAVRQTIADNFHEGMLSQ